MTVDINPTDLINHTLKLHSKGWLTKDQATEVIIQQLAKTPEPFKTQQSLFLKSAGWDLEGGDHP